MTTDAPPALARACADVMWADDQAAQERARAGRSGIYDVPITRSDGTVIAEFRSHSRVVGSFFATDARSGGSIVRRRREQLRSSCLAQRLYAPADALTARNWRLDSNHARANEPSARRPGYQNHCDAGRHQLGRRHFRRLAYGANGSCRRQCSGKARSGALRYRRCERNGLPSAGQRGRRA
jgi:hypothetical protein